jgi:hypothetical protein
MRIRWREKFRAFGIHFILTAIVAGAAGWLIFGVWFPDPFAALAGGLRLFLLIACCDLVLGPLLSLVVYDSQKSRGKLLFDYAVISILQLGSLAYGVSIMSGARPVYIAFVGDRLEVVTAKDLRPDEVAAARSPEYDKVQFTGMRFVAVEVPPAERQAAMFAELDGNEEAARPRFYVPYESALANIRAHALPLDELVRRHPTDSAAIAAARTGLAVPEPRLRWLPVRFHREFWTALIDMQTGKPVRYLQLDPY